MWLLLGDLRLVRSSHCKVIIRIGGMEVVAVIDTGASQCALTKDCIRRLGLLRRIIQQDPHYLVPDGRRTMTHGTLPDVPLPWTG